MNLIDSLSHCSPLRNKSPLYKFLLAILTLIISVTAVDSLISTIVLISMVSLTLFWNQTPIRIYLRLLLVPITFFLIGACSIFINIAPKPLDLFALPIYNYYLTASSEGLFQALKLILNAFSAVSCLYFLALSTPIMDILDVLRLLHIPVLFIELMMLIYRFLFLILNLTDSIWTSIICRMGNRNIKTSLTAMGNMLSIVLVRALQSSSRLYDSMEARNYNGRIIILRPSYPTSYISWAFLVIFDLSLLVLTIFRRI